jgi:hypothetical protein
MHNQGNAGSRHARHPALRARSWRKPSRNSPVPAAAPRLRDGTADPLPLSWEPTPASELQARFDVLAERWRGETEFASAPNALFMNPAYQEIIGLGPAVLPLILRDLAQTHDHWFWALRAITGADPVPPEERGRVERMAEHWLEWGRAAGLL